MRQEVRFTPHGPRVGIPTPFTQAEARARIDRIAKRLAYEVVTGDLGFYDAEYYLFRSAVALGCSDDDYAIDTLNVEVTYLDNARLRDCTIIRLFATARFGKISSDKILEECKKATYTLSESEVREVLRSAWREWKKK